MSKGFGFGDQLYIIIEALNYVKDSVTKYYSSKTFNSPPIVHSAIEFERKEREEELESVINLIVDRFSGSVGVNQENHYYQIIRSALEVYLVELRNHAELTMARDKITTIEELVIDDHRLRDKRTDLFEEMVGATHNSKKYKIFIAHASEDAEYVRGIRDRLSNICEFEPYLAQDYPSYGENFKTRIQNAIESCDFFIVNMTANTLSNQWVNQEIGYASAVKRKDESRLHIIPISNYDLRVRGMITRDTEDFLITDRKDDKTIIKGIIDFIRSKIENGNEQGTLHYKIRCDHCRDDTNIPTQYTREVPSKLTLDRAIAEGEESWCTHCDNCHENNYSSIYTWQRTDGKTVL